MKKEIYEYVKRKVDLLDYMETHLGMNIRHNSDDSGVSLCPFHEDSVPSFRISQIEGDGVWLYYCFGCGATGTIIDFFQKYHSLPNAHEAVKKICQDLNLDIEEKDLSDLPVKKINIKKTMECAHIVACHQCRCLLRQDYKKHSKWVAQTYKRMNDALDRESLEEIEEIGNDAFARGSM